jgi:Protein of unknown function (DUF2586).
MNDVIFNRGEGGLGRALAGEDHVSGLIFYLASADIPTSFETDKIKLIYSLAEAEALGIILDESARLDHIHYQIETAFMANPKLVLYVAIYPDTAGVVDLTKIVEVQRFAEGKIRQIGVCNDFIQFAIGDIATLQANADILEAEHKPLSVIYSAKTGTMTTSTLPDLRAQDAKNVSMVIATDGAGKGSALAVSSSTKPSIIGMTIGAISVAKVNENIGWVGRFNVTKNVINEFDVPALMTGELYKNLAPSLVDALNTKGYIFLIKHVGTAGTYFNDTHTAKVVSSDYAFIENNRTIDKSVRGVRSFLLPSLNAPLYVNGDGTLTEDTIAGFRNDALRALEQMERDGEISGKDVIINPAQNVLTSSKIELTVQIVPVGVARKIVVNIGFVVKLS